MTEKVRHVRKKFMIGNAIRLMEEALEEGIAIRASDIDVCASDASASVIFTAESRRRREFAKSVPPLRQLRASCVSAVDLLLFEPQSRRGAEDLRTP